MKMIMPIALATACAIGAHAATATFENGAWDVLPQADDDIVIRGGADVDITWDASMPATVASWTQESTFANSVVFHTTFADNAYPLVTITGDASLQGGKWTHPLNGGSRTYRLNVAIGGDLTIGAGASITALANGYQGGSNGGSGVGCYGGIGHSYTQSGISWASTYGSIYEPVDLGSGGEAGSWVYAGGGAIRLDVAGATSIDGAIRADGAGQYTLPGYTGNGHYTGTGGSVWLTTGTISGSGSIAANGGDAIYHMMGSGGRVAVTLTASGADFSNFTDASEGAIAAFGGRGTTYPNNYGAAGTVYLRTAAQAQDDGLLIIDNNNNPLSSATHHTTLIAASQTDTTFGEIVIRRNGWLAIDPGQTIRVKRGIRNDNSNANFGIDTYYKGAIELIDASVPATISGNTTFGTLVCTAAGKTINFAAGSTTTIADSLSLAGTANAPVALRSTESGTPWKLSLSNTTAQNLEYLDVSDSSSIAAVAAALFSTDSLGNTGWDFVVPGADVVWTGAGGTAWGSGANWNVGRAPVSTDDVTIPADCANYPALDLDRCVGSLTVEAGAALSLAGFNLDIAGDFALAGSLAASAAETIAVGGDIDLASGSFTAAQSTLLLDGADDQSATFGAVAPFAVSVMKESGVATFTGAFSGDSVQVESSSATFLGDVSVASFSAKSTSAAATAEVAPGKTVSTGSLTLAGGSNALNLRSISDGFPFNMAVSGAASVSGATIKDSVATPMSIVALTSTDAGGNSNWIFSNDVATWTGAVSTDFAAAGNWSSGATPTETTHVIIPETANECHVSAPAAIASLSISGSAAATFHADAALEIGGNLVVGENGVAILNKPVSVAGSCAVLAGGKITHDGNWNTEANKIDVTVAGSFTLSAGATIDAYAKGFAQGSFGSRASYAGIGGNANAFNNASVYGSIYRPTNLGATGEGWGNGYEGGGAIHFDVTGPATIDGTINANALAPTANNHYSGTGGSIWIEAATISGSGDITANGGDTVYHTLGSGGRIALTVRQADSTLAITGRLEAHGGFGGNTSESWGAAGTIYLRDGGQDIDEGTLIIDNYGVAISRNRGHATLIDSHIADRTFGEIIVRNAGWLLAGNGITLKVKRGISVEASATAAGLGLDDSFDSAIEFIDPSVDAVVSGDIKFSRLVCNTPGKRILFAPGSSSAVKNGLELNGDETGDIILGSTESGSPWTLNVTLTAEQSATYIDVSDSDASSGAVVAAFSSKDSGNNSNWSFAAIGETITWTGATDTNWGLGSNWDLARTPKETDKVVIPAGCDRYPALIANVAATTLTIGEGASLDLNGFNIGVADDLAVSGSLVARGSEFITLLATNVAFAAEAFTAASSTVVFDGDSAQSASLAGNTFFRIVSSNAAARVTFADDFEADTFESVSGDLGFDDGFSVGAFAVAADAAPVSITVAPGSVAAMQTLALHGAGNGITLASATPGSAFSLAVANASDVRNVTVSDCTASASTIVPISATDAGNNVNWIFNEPWAVWTGAVSTDFSNAGNWSPNVVPDDSTRVLIDNVAIDCIANEAVTLKELAVGGTGPATFTAYAAIAVSNDVLVANGGRLSLNKPSAIAGSVDILAGGTITHEANPDTERYRIDLAIAGDLTIRDGAKISAYGKGYNPDRAPQGFQRYCHGGLGGGIRPAGNTVYGSIYCPTNCGAGGGWIGELAHSGGGAVKLDVAGDAIVDGSIDADAVTEFYSNTHYSGAGGSVWLIASTLSGCGSITANGGDINYHQTGSGGRIAVTLTKNGADFDDFTGTILARGGLGNKGMTWNYTSYFHSWGQAGTVYLREGGQAIDEGTLVIDNANSDSYRGMDNNPSAYFNSVIEDRAFGRVVIRNKGRIGVADGVSINVKDGWDNTGLPGDYSTGEVVFTGSDVAISGDTTWNDLTFTTVDGTVSFAPGSTQTIYGDVVFADHSTLQSTTDGQPWKIVVNGNSGTPYDVGRVFVKDSDASSGRTIRAHAGCRDLGDNENWIFTPIAGTIFLLR